MTDIGSILIDTIRRAFAEQAGKDKYGWAKGLYKEMRELQTDTRGDVGEDFIAELLRQLGRDVRHTRRTDSQKKQWDIICDGVKLEVKTATMGMANATFQHENLEKDRDYDGVIFVDIAPDDIYIIFMAKEDIDWRNVHHRRTGISRKYDWGLNRIKESQIETLEEFQFAYEEFERRIRAIKATRPAAEDI